MSDLINGEAVSDKLINYSFPLWELQCEWTKTKKKNWCVNISSASNIESQAVFHSERLWPLICSEQYVLLLLPDPDVAACCWRDAWLTIFGCSHHLAINFGCLSSVKTFITFLNTRWIFAKKIHITFVKLFQKFDIERWWSTFCF